jgi:hypothetical protein
LAERPVGSAPSTSPPEIQLQSEVAMSNCQQSASGPLSHAPPRKYSTPAAGFDAAADPYLPEGMLLELGNLNWPKSELWVEAASENTHVH